MFKEYTNEIFESGSYKNIGKTKYTNDKLITDHYAIIPTGQGLNNLNSMPPLNVKVYEVIVRRLGDETRQRDAEKAKDIQLHQEMNRAAAMAYATLTGATVKIISNHDNHLTSTVKKMVNVLK